MPLGTLSFYPNPQQAGQVHLYTDIEFTKLLNYRALTKIIKGQKNWPEVPLAKLQWSHLAQTLAVIEEFPQPAILTVLQNPRIKDGEQSHFLALRFQFEHDLFRNVSSIA